MKLPDLNDKFPVALTLNNLNQEKQILLDESNNKIL
jgi:hypothetical protein